jgi:hypothetical protein
MTPVIGFTTTIVDNFSCYFPTNSRENCTTNLLVFETREISKGVQGPKLAPGRFDHFLYTSRIKFIKWLKLKISFAGKPVEKRTKGFWHRLCPGRRSVTLARNTFCLMTKINTQYNALERKPDGSLQSTVQRSFEPVFCFT